MTNTCAVAQGESVAEPLFIFPFNGTGLEALDCLGDRYRLVAFIDDTPEKQGRSPRGYEVLGRQAFAHTPKTAVLAVPGSPISYRHRRTIIEGLELNVSRFVRVVHPSAYISPLATLGSNVLLMAGVVVTSNAVIGNHVCVLPNTVIHHDAVVGDFSLIGSNVTVTGGVVIGENCYIGSGTSLMNGIRVGEGALVGLGSNVICDVPAGARVAGNPAKQIS